MKLTKKLQIVGNRIMDKLVRVSSIEKFERVLEDKKIEYGKINEEYSDLVAEIKVLEKSYNDSTDLIERLLDEISKIDKEKDPELYNEGFNVYRKSESERTVIKEHLDTLKKVEANLSSILEDLTGEIEEFNMKLNELRLKAKTAESLKRYTNVTGTNHLDTNELKDASIEIEKEFIKSDTKLKGMISTKNKENKFFKDVNKLKEMEDFENKLAERRNKQN